MINAKPGGEIGTGAPYPKEVKWSDDFSVSVNKGVAFNKVVLESHAVFPNVAFQKCISNSPEDASPYHWKQHLF